MFASIKLYTNFTESIRRNYLKNNATKMKTTKFDVIQLIVESEQASPETFKPIFLTAIAHGAKEVCNAQADVKHVKPLIDSASYLIGQIEDIDIKIMLAENQEMSNEPSFLNGVMDLHRQKRQYIETLTTVLNKL